MIKVNKGKVKCSGNGNELLAEFAIVVRSMTEVLEGAFSRDVAIRILDRAYESGKMTEEEVKAKLEEMIAKMAEEEEKN